MTRKELAYRKFIRLSRGGAFKRGFFRIFGLTSYYIEPPVLTEREALQEDFITISKDINRVFCRETELIDNVES